MGVGSQFACSEKIWKINEHLQVLKGGDPSAAKTSARAEPTVAELCGKFMEDYSKLRNKPSTQRDYWAKRR